MKKFLLLLLFVGICFSITSCVKDEEVEVVPTPVEPQPSIPSEPTPVPSVPTVPPVVTPQEYYENPFVTSETNYQHIELDKFVYSFEDDIVIDIFDAKSSDYVAVFDMDGEPGGVGSVYYKRNKVSSKKQITFNVSDMELTPGEYCVCLYSSTDMFLYDRVMFKVWDGDVTDYKVESATIDFKNINGIRTSSITLTPSTNKNLTYQFFWAKDGVRLEGYSYLDYVTKTSNSPFTVNFKDNMYMPREANQIEVYILEGNSTSYFVDIDSEFSLEKSKYLFNFQVFSDVHSDVNEKTWNSHFKTALIDVMRLSGNSSGIFIVGDSTNFGSQTCYKLLRDTISSYIPEHGPKVYLTLGNHEYQYYEGKGYDYAIDYFYQQTGVENLYYSVEINGVKFIILGSDSLDKTGYMSDEQWNWFEQEMKNVDKNKPTFVFFHQPLANILAGMDSGKEAGGFSNVRARMLEILSYNPNTYCFNGHTHMTFETEKTAIFGKGQTANFINTGAIAYLNDINYNEIVGSLGLFVEVYEDYVMINGRNFYTGEWVSEAMFVSPIYKVYDAE